MSPPCPPAARGARVDGRGEALLPTTTNRYSRRASILHLCRYWGQWTKRRIFFPNSTATWAYGTVDGLEAFDALLIPHAAAAGDRSVAPAVHRHDGLHALCAPELGDIYYTFYYYDSPCISETGMSRWILDLLNQDDRCQFTSIPLCKACWVLKD